MPLFLPRTLLRLCQIQQCGTLYSAALVPVLVVFISVTRVKSPIWGGGVYLGISLTCLINCSSINDR